MADRKANFPGLLAIVLYSIAYLTTLIDHFAGAMAFIGVSIFLAIAVFSLFWKQWKGDEKSPSIGGN